MAIIIIAVVCVWVGVILIMRGMDARTTMRARTMQQAVRMSYPVKGVRTGR